MATEKLLRAIVSGPADQIDCALRTLVLDRDFHPLPASESLAPLKGSRPFGDPNPYEAPLNGALSLLSRLGIAPAYFPFEDANHALEACTAYLTRTGSAVSRILTHRSAEESLASANDALADRLSHFSELGADLTELLAVKLLDLRFGRVPIEDYPELADYAAGCPSVYLVRTGRDAQNIYCIYFALTSDCDRLAEEFLHFGFEYEERPDEHGFFGVPAERIAQLASESAEARRKVAALTAELRALAAKEHDALLSRYAWLRYMSRAFELRAFAVRKGGRFYFTGWVPVKSAEAFDADARSLGLACALEKPSRADITQAPAKFTTGFFSRIYSPYVRMYGYPAYGELDPRIFVAFTYTLLFGIMFGDVGQGAVLVLLGLFFTRKKMWLGRIMTAVGLSSIVFGLVYGSVFGNEHWLPGFKVMEDGNMTAMLGLSVAVGCLLILVCVVLNVMTGFRQHDLKKAVFSANGILGGILYLALIAGLGAQLLLDADLWSPSYVLGLIVLPAVCIFCGGPLARLLEGHADWRPESFGMFFIDGFFGLFEAALSWLSNTVSFLRVGAYAICHAGMMMVVYLLSATSSGKTAVWGVVLGNVLVMTIEAVLVSIQVLRLEFYEMFGRFYSGTGAPFTPQTVDYAHPAVHG